MEALKGRSILIGKNPGQNNVLIAVKGVPRTGVAGEPNSVPNSVSRCIPTQSVGHARIDIDMNGNMTITNLKHMNVTYVNGAQVESKRIDSSSIIELGMDRYRMNTAAVLKAAKKIIGPAAGPAQVHPGHRPQPQPQQQAQAQQQDNQQYNILHLREVYRGYNEYVKKLDKDARNRANMQRIPIFFTMGGGVISSLAVFLNWDESIRYLCFGLTIIGLILMIVLFIMSRNDTTADKKELAKDQFQDRYVCPKCGRFLGHQSYKLLKKQYGMQCPYCKCKYVEY